MASLNSPDNFFLIVMRHLAWLVSNLNGVKFLSCVELASMRTVCQDSSLKISINPLAGSLRRVTRKSPCSHFGVLDSTRIRDICTDAVNAGLWNFTFTVFTVMVMPSMTLWIKLQDKGHLSLLLNWKINVVGWPIFSLWRRYWLYTRRWGLCAAPKLTCLDRYVYLVQTLKRDLWRVALIFGDLIDLIV